MIKHSCKRCGTTMSVFWYPVRIGVQEFELCDSCFAGLAHFLEDRA